MAITFNTMLNYAFNKTSSNQISIGTAQAVAGDGTKFLLIGIAKDNTSTASGDNSEVTSITDSGFNTYTKIAERTNAGTAGASVTASLWLGIINNALTNANAININFSANTSAKVAVAMLFNRGANNDIQVGAHAEAESDGAGGGASISVNPPDSREWLAFRMEASEIDTGGGSNWATNTTNWSSSDSGGPSTSGGGAASNMSHNAEHRIFTTGATVTSNPGAGSAGNADRASIIALLKEVATNPQIVGAAAVSATTAANVAVVGHPVLTVQSAASVTTAANASVYMTPIPLTVQSAVSATAANSPTLAPKTALVPAAAASATTAENVILSGIDITPASAVSATVAANVTLTPRSALTVASASSATTAASPTLAVPAGTALAPSASASPTHSGMYGPNVVPEGDFNTNTGWGLNPIEGSLTITGGKLVGTAAEGDVERFDATFSVIGATYIVEVDVDSISVGSIAAVYGNAAPAVDIFTAGHYAATLFTAEAGTYVELFFNGNYTDHPGPTTATLDNFSIRQILPVVMVAKLGLVPASGVSATAAASPTLAAKTTLTPSASASATTANSPALAAKTTLAPSASNSVTTATAASLFPKIFGNAGVSPTTASNVILLPKTALVPSPSRSLSVAASPTLAAKANINASASQSATTSASPTLTYTFTINVLEGNEGAVFYPSLAEHTKPVWPSTYIEL